MTRTRSPVFVSLIASLGLLTGCPTPAPDDGGTGDAGPTPDAVSGDATTHDAPIPTTVPIFRNPVSTPDAELARQALQIMGSTDAGATRILCNDCHDLTRQRIHYWRALSDTALSTCLTDLTLAGGDAAAADVVSCARGGDGRFGSFRLGIFATAGDLDWFRYVFAHGGAVGDHDAFLAQAAMPRDYPPLTQAEFDILAEWFIRGVPGVDDIIPADSLPTECTPGVSADMVDYITSRATNNWSTVNAGAGMVMYGCAGAATAADCLATETLASTTSYGADWDDTGASGVPGARNRVLYTTTYPSSYWTRSSADGRFVAHGADRSSHMAFVDLAGGGSGPDTARVFFGNAAYDPFFFPDDSGFMVQNVTRMCEMSVLTTGMPTEIDFTTAPGCGGAGGVGLYEHLGAALGGGDYWAIDSTTGAKFATYDDGGQTPTRSNPGSAGFSGEDAHSTVRFFVNEGSRFRAGGFVEIPHPHEGDAVISPSTGLLLTRQAGESGPLGYVVRTLTASGPATSRTVEATEVARFCINGGKAGFSYDERFFVIHRYVEASDAVELGFSGPSDPAFAPYLTRGAANTYLVDMATGLTHRITNMGPGQYALFPHFRSDGWIYMQVRTEGEGPEHVLASDAALLIAPL